MFSGLKQKMGAFLCALWIRSLKIRLSVPEDFRPGVLGLWHRDLFASTAAFKDKNVHILVSKSQDGEFFARGAMKLGYQVTRGSDSHGSSNVRYLLQSLASGRFVGMALDGPKGPALEVKPGSLWLAKKSGCPLWHFHIRYGAHITLKTWDKFIIPLPLTTIDVQIKYLSFSKKNQK